MYCTLLTYIIIIDLYSGGSRGGARGAKKFFWVSEQPPPPPPTPQAPYLKVWIRHCFRF